METIEPQRYPDRAPRKKRVLAISIHGALNDETELPKIPVKTPETAINAIAIDWAKLRYVCGSGVALWLQWVKDAKSAQPGIEFEFLNCPLSLLRVLGTVREILPANGRISSISASADDLPIEVMGLLPHPPVALHKAQAAPVGDQNSPCTRTA